MGRTKRENPQENKRKPSDFKKGKAYDWPKIKSAFFDSDYVEALTFLGSVFGKLSGTMRSKPT